MKLFLAMVGHLIVLVLAMVGAYQVGEALTGEWTRRSAHVDVSGPPVVTRHGTEVHIVLDDGTLFVIPASGCVLIVRADEHEGTCLD